ncbi:MAG: FAD-dependent oxidoreductase [Tannerella sp.]|nr:FAD-dependent oxidoreductase [Tannerella sp.]
MEKKESRKEIDRRMFFKTSGLMVAGLGLPAVGVAQTNVATDDKLSPQQHPNISYDADYVVVGGGVAGVCSAITAARAGLKVALIQDRPVLGGNASSEVRLWVLGATSHMGNNNRWAREGGVLEELLVENMYRNKEGNSIFFDTLLLEKVWAEPNITLLLNTAVYNIEMGGPSQIRKVFAFCSQNSTQYEFSAPYFCDASGDGIIAFLSGASFRVGAEKAEEFGEKFIMPDDYGKLLGHSMYFYSKDAGRPVKYVPPAFALKDIPSKVPRFKDIHRDSSGCRLWWLEWGDELDRVYDSEKIKEELWRVVYGVWDYIKNSGTFTDVDNLTLEWVSTIPGKRESRRFEGDYILKQQDVIKQEPFDDAIAFGGWAIDLHPAKGVYSAYHGCTQYHSKGVYTIPYRCIYSRNVSNLFMAGRLISVSHAAFGSTRVISTGTLCAQAAALAAAICKKNNLLPREVYSGGHIGELQTQLMQTGQYVPRLQLKHPQDLIPSAKLAVSGTFALSELPEDGTWRTLNRDSAMLLPFAAGKTPALTFSLKAEAPTGLKASLYISSRFGNYTPDVCLATREYPLPAGASSLTVRFDQSLEKAQYGLVVLEKNEQISVAQSQVRVTGVLSLFHSWTQEQNDAYGFEEIPFYAPERRPGGKNLAMKVHPAIQSFTASQLHSGVFRPANGAVNAWIAPLSDKTAQVRCEWKQTQRIQRIVLWFDSDYDHAMESCLMGHPEDVMPFCVQRYRILDDAGKTVFEVSDNHHSRNEIRLEKPLLTSAITIQPERPHDHVPISLFGVQAFES